MKTWSEVTNSDAYKKLSSSEKQRAKNEYWDTVVVPKAGYKELSKNDQLSAKKEFFGEKSPGVEYQNITGQMFNVPGAAITSGLMGRGYIEGALNPSQVPTGADIGRNIGVNIAGRMPQSIAPIAGDLLGQVGQDIGSIVDPRNIVNPITVAALTSQLGAVKNAASSIAQTKPAKKLINAMKGLFSKKDALGGTINKIDDIAEKYVQASNKVKQELVVKYGNKLDEIADGINEVIPMGDDVGAVVDDAIERFPGISNKKELLSIKNTTQTKHLTGKEAVNLKQRVMKSVPQGVKTGRVAPNPEQSARMSIADKIDELLLDKAPEKYAKMKAEYRDTKRAIDDVKRLFFEGGYPGGGNVTKGWLPGYGISPRQTRSLQEVSKLAGENPWVAFNRWRQMEALKRGAIGTIGGGIAYGMRRKVGEKALSE